MASRTVDYIFQLIDRFSPNAQKMQSVAATTTQSIHKMGDAFVQMEQKARRAAIMSQETATQRYETAKHQFEKYRDFQHKTIDAMNAAATGLMTFGLGNSAVRGLDHIVEKAADLQTIQAKLAQAGVSAGELQRGTTKSFALAGKYRNLSATEVLELINDARTNLIGSFDDILQNIEPLTRLGAFMKAFDGGKHAGKHKDLLNELNFAMQSGELLSKVSAKEIGQHAEMMGVMKVAFGSKFKAAQYLTAQRNTNSALLSMDDEMKYAFFPALAQSLGVRAGTGLATMTNKLLSGIMIRDSSVKLADSLNLLDKGTYSINGKGKVTKAADGLRWNNQDLYAANPVRWIYEELLPKIQGKVRGLDAAAFNKAFETGDQHALEEIIKHIDKGDLTRVLGQLMYDRTAKNFIEEAIVMAAKILKDKSQIDRVNRNFDAFNTYDKSKQGFFAAFDDFLSIWAGPMVAIASRRLDQLASVLTRINNFGARNPGLVSWVSWLAMMAAVAATAALTIGALVLGLRVLGSLLGASSLIRYGGGLLGGLMAGGAGAAAAGAGVAVAAARYGRVAAALRGLWAIASRVTVALTALQVAFMVGEPIVAHWTAIAARLKAIWADMIGVFKSLGSSEKGATGKAAEKLSRTTGKAYDDYGDWLKQTEFADWVYSILPQIRPGLDGMALAGVQGVNPDRTRPWAMTGGADSIPAGEAQREISIRSQVDVTQSVPLTGNVNVTVQGTINGAVTGAGEAQITGAAAAKSNASRGESAPAKQ